MTILLSRMGYIFYTHRFTIQLHALAHVFHHVRRASPIPLFACLLFHDVIPFGLPITTMISQTAREGVPEAGCRIRGSKARDWQEGCQGMFSPSCVDTTIICLCCLPHSPAFDTVQYCYIRGIMVWYMPECVCTCRATNAPHLSPA